MLWGYLRDLFQTPGFGDTVDFVQIKQHYYIVHTDINRPRSCRWVPICRVCSPRMDEKRSAAHPSGTAPLNPVRPDEQPTARRNPLYPA